MQKSRRSENVDLRIPTEDEILENPKRAKFIGGGWVDSLDTNIINLYWHKHQDHFTIYSLLQVLEHETLHVVLAKTVNLETSEKLDNIHRSSCIRLSSGRPVFINQILIEKWSYPPYSEKPTDISSNHGTKTQM